MSEEIPKSQIRKALDAIITDIAAAEPSSKKDLAIAAKNLSDILVGDKATQAVSFVEQLQQMLGAPGTEPDDGQVPSHLKEEQ